MQRRTAATPSSKSRHEPLAERIQKVLADLGLGSRRQIDRWVVEGRITIDGRAAKPGDQLRGNERVCVDGRPVKRSFGRRAAPQPSFAAYYKPSGLPTGVEGAQGAGRREMPDPPKHGRWLAVGALDTNAAGLVVLTTDGTLANRLTRRGSGLQQEFAARLLGHPTPAQLRQLTDGVELEDGLVRPESIERGGGTGTNVWYHVVLLDAGSREFRALLDAAGLAISRIIRVRCGPVKLGTLRRGQSRPLTRAETDALYGLVAGDKAATHS